MTEQPPFSTNILQSPLVDLKDVDKRLLLNNLYDRYAPYILGLIIRQNITDKNETLIKIFLHTWRNINWFAENKSITSLK